MSLGKQSTGSSLIPAHLLSQSCPAAEQKCCAKAGGHCLPFCLFPACTCCQFRSVAASGEGKAWGRRQGGVGTPGCTWCLC